jgi:transcriptional regulator with XRE-family HTH domain
MLTEEQWLRMRIAKNLRKLMKERGLTGYRLASRLDMKYDNIKRYMDGSATIGYGLLRTISDYFGVTIDYFIWE